MDRGSLLNDPEEATRTFLEGSQSNLWTALPGIVNSVQLDKMTVSVQPAIKGTIQDENGNSQSINLPVLTDVPIVFPSAGGFTITFPVAVGDEVLVVFSSRCIDAWWQSGGIQMAMEVRMHDLSDGFAIPGPRSQPNVLSAISGTGVQIRNNAGTSYVEIAADGKVKLVSPSEIDITAPAIKMTGAVDITGTLHVTGPVTTDSLITAIGALTGASITTVGVGTATIGGSISTSGNISGGAIFEGSIRLGTHKHTGVVSGGNTSGGPTP